MLGFTWTYEYKESDIFLKADYNPADVKLSSKYKIIPIKTVKDFTFGKIVLENDFIQIKHNNNITRTIIL